MKILTFSRLAISKSNYIRVNPGLCPCNYPSRDTQWRVRWLSLNMCRCSFGSPIIFRQSVVWALITMPSFIWKSIYALDDAWAYAWEITDYTQWDEGRGKGGYHRCCCLVFREEGEIWHYKWVYGTHTQIESFSAVLGSEMLLFICLALQAEKWGSFDNNVLFSSQ